MADEMTLDKALLKIVELEETIENQNTTLNTLKEENEAKEKEVKELQKSNMSLFLKITNKTDEGQDDNDNDVETNDKGNKMEKLISTWGFN